MGKGIAGVRAAVDSAPIVGAKPDTIEFEGDQDAGLPEESPVTPLGVNGTIRYYLDCNRQLIALEAREHSRLGLQGLVGRKAEWLYKNFPRMDKDGNVTGWKPEAFAEALFEACSIKGVWDPHERERGVGAWRGDDGELVLHVGDKILIYPTGKNAYQRQVACAPGTIGRYVYPAGEALPVPAEGFIKGGELGPAAELLTLLKTWNWRRGEIDAVLLLGWIGAALIGGALKWRSLAWITGGAGTGKSTLHELLQLVVLRLLQASDPSAAGIWQTLKHSTMPVAVDELESEEDNRKNYAIVKLARQAASGGKLLRGGANHEASQFTVRSTFLFSSILVPPLMGQDRSRLAILELDQLGKDAVPPKLDGKKWRRIGAELLRRLIDNWHRFDDTLEFYRASLAQAGHSARGADQFGTLLACADVLLHDAEPDADSADAWISKLGAANIAETDDQSRDEDRCLQHLLSSPVDPFRNGARHMVGYWVRVAAGLVDGEPAEANRALGTFGLKVVQQRKTAYLAIANAHQGLAQLFANTHWAAKAGTAGVWMQAIRRLPGACQPEGAGGGTKALYFSGVIAKATLIPIAIVAPDTPDTPPPPPQNMDLPDV